MELSTLCICSNCKTFFLILNQNELENKKLDDHNLKINIKIFKKDIINPKQLESFQIYLEMIDLFSDYEFSNFPLCSHCLSSNLRQISIFSHHIYDSINNIENFFKKIPFNILKYSIESSIKENNLIEPKIFINNKFEPQILNYIKTKIKLNNINLKEFDIIKDPNINKLNFLIPRNSLIISTTFFISFYRYCGTINGIPLSINEFNSHTVTLTNSGLYLLIHLIKLILDSLLISGPFIYFNQVPYIGDNENNLYPFCIPEVINKNSINSFNKSLKILFLTCYDLFSFTSQLSNSKIPYNIDIKKFKIGNISFLFKWNKRFKWSRSMKLLLTNLKFEQLRSLKSFLHL